MRFGKGVHLLLWLLIGSLAALGGCDDDDDADLTGIQVDPSVASINMEQTQEFTAVAEYDNGDTEDVTERATWTSSDEDVATVDENGVATPVGEGETTITATFSGEEASAELTVESDGVLESCAVEPTDVSLSVGGTETFTVMGQYSDGSTEDISDAAEWSSDDTSVADVDSDGEVTGVGGGETDVEATVNDVDCDAATVTVSDQPCETLTVTGDETELIAGNTLQLTATCVMGGEPMDVTDDVEWTSDNEDAATVSDDGEVTAVAEGDVEITATYTNPDDTTLDDSYALTIIEAPLEEISVSPVTATLNDTGANQAYTATCQYADGISNDCTDSVTWNSSDEAVATISNADDNEGLATSVSNGTTQITATLGEITSNIAVLIVNVDVVCESVSVSPSDATIPAGETQAFSAVCNMSDGTTSTSYTFTWESEPETFATIDSAGLATGVAAGDAEITASVSVDGTPVTSEPSILTVTDAVVVGLEVSPTAVSVPAGRTRTLAATALYSDGSTVDVTATAGWTPGDPAIASVVAGVVTGEAAGETTVTATYGTFSAEAAVIVTPAVCTSLTVDPATETIGIGLEVRLIATCSMSDGTTDIVTGDADWRSSAPGIAFVDTVAPNIGRVEGIAEGVATITAEFGTFSDTAEITVEPITCESIAVTPSSATIADGTTFDFTATCTMTDGTTRDDFAFTWESVPSAVAGINDDGLATGRDPGTAAITASFDGVTSPAATLEVTDAVVTSLEVSPTLLALPNGTSDNMTATAIFSDGTSQTVTADASWAVIPADGSIVAVSNADGSEGQVTGVSEGTATVTAEYGGFDASATVNVTGGVCESLSVSPTPTSIAAGRTVELSATCENTDGTTRDVTPLASWNDPTPTIATVGNADPNWGVVTGVSAGVATISATYLTFTADAEVTVTDAVLESITIENADDIAAGLDRQLQARGSYSDGTTPLITDEVTWSVNPVDGSIAIVSNADGNEGLVTGVAVGTAIITATDPVTSINVSVSINVTSAVIDRIEVSPATTDLPLGFTEQFEAFATLTDSSVVNVTDTVNWSVVPVDGSVATVSNAEDSEGLVTATGAGTATITATSSGGVSDSGTVTVSTAAPTDLIIRPDAAGSPDVYYNGGTQQFTAELVFDDGSSMFVTDDTNWTIDPDAGAIGTIDNSGVDRGLFSATAVGTGTIIAFYAGIESSVAIEVVAPPTLDYIVVTSDHDDLPIGETFQFSCIAYYTGGADPVDVTAEAASTFDSDDEDVATITDGGVLTTVAAGTDVVITCTYEDETSDGYLIDVFDCTPSSVTVSALNPTETGETFEIYADTSRQLVATVEYVDDICDSRDVTEDVTWTSFATDVITVSNADGTEGLATAVGAREETATIEARLLGTGLSDTATVEIVTGCFEDLRIIPSDPTLPIGARLDMDAEALTSDGEWISVNPTWTRESLSTNRFSFHDSATGEIEGQSAGAQDLIARVTTTLCSGVTSPLEATTTVTVTDVDLTDVVIENIPSGPLPVGNVEHQYVATAIYSDGREIDVTDRATWNSTVTSIATIGANNGLAVTNDSGNEGTTTITVSWGGFVDSTTLTVENLTQTDLRIRELATSTTRLDSTGLGATVTTPENVNLHFECTALYTGGENVELAGNTPSPFSVSDTDVLQNTGVVVDDALRIRTSADGTADVTCSYNGFSATMRIEVATQTVTGFSVDPDSVTINLDQTYNMTAWATFASGSTFDVTLLSDWESLVPASVSVGATTGVITGLTADTGVGVRATYGTSIDTAIVNVSDSCFESITISPSSTSVAVGESDTFTVEGTYADGTPGTPTVDEWVYDSDIARRTSGSTFRGEGVGSTTITVRVTDDLCGGLTVLEDSATFNVTASTITDITISCEDSGLTMSPWEVQQCQALADYTDGREDVDVSGACTWTGSGAIDVAGVGMVEAVTAAATGIVTCEHPDYGDAFETITVADCTLSGIVLSRQIGGVLPVGYTDVFDSIEATYTGGCTNLDITDYSATITDTSDDTILGVDGDVVTGVAAGEADFEVDFHTASETETITVELWTLDTDGITVNLGSSSIREGETTNAAATADFNGGTVSRSVTRECGWLSTLPSVADFLDADTNVVTGLSTGTTNISCSIGAENDSAPLDVEEACLDHIEVLVDATSPVPHTVMVTFTVLGYYGDGSPAVDLTTNSHVGWNLNGLLTAAPSSDTETAGQALTSDSSVGPANIVATIDDTGDATPFTMCSGTSVTDSVSFEVDATIDLDSLRIVPDPLTIASGGEGHLIAYGVFDNSVEYNVSDRVDWTTSDSAIAAVAAQNGTVTGESVGDAIISATEGTVNADALVQVSDAILTDIVITVPLTRLDLSVDEIPEGGHHVQLSAVGEFSDSTTRSIDVSWSIQEAETYGTTINADGVLTSGDVTADRTLHIVATADGVTSSTPAAVVIANGEVIGVDITDPAGVTATITEGETQGWIAEVHFDVDGGAVSYDRQYVGTHVVDWTSDNTAIATASNFDGEEGDVTGVLSGITTIRATRNGVFDAVDLTVLDRDVSYISVEVAGDPSVACPSETGEQFDVRIHYTDGTSTIATSGVTWYRDSLPGDPWYNYYCADPGADPDDGIFYSDDYLPEFVGGDSCDGVSVMLDACVTIAETTYCSYYVAEGSTHEGYLDIDESATDCTENLP